MNFTGKKKGKGKEHSTCLPPKVRSAGRNAVVSDSTRIRMVSEIALETVQSPQGKEGKVCVVSVTYSVR